jgi:NADH-quinone oxidoreductase subunit B
MGVGRESPLQHLIRYSTAHSLWPLMLGLDYCTLELYGALGPHFDQARFGAEVYRPSPRQVDVLLVAGVVTRKMGPVIRRLFEAMAEPRFVIAVGAGAISGGPFADSYAVAGGVDRIVPVDVYVLGDPPRPEAIIDAIRLLTQRISKGEVAL